MLARRRRPVTVVTTARMALYAALAAGWAAVAWVLSGSVVPDDLSLPRVDVDAVFGAQLVDRAERYERFHYANWALAQVVLLVTLGVYARRGAAFARESAAGPIGTGMFVGMVGLAIVWLTQLPSRWPRSGGSGATASRRWDTSRRSSADGSPSEGRSSPSASRCSS